MRQLGQIVFVVGLLAILNPGPAQAAPMTPEERAEKKERKAKEKAAKAKKKVEDKMVKSLAGRRHCDPATITLDHLKSGWAGSVEQNTWLLTGCGDIPPFILTWWDSGGVWSFFTDESLRTRAPFDMDCSAAELTYTFIDENTRGVTGCAQRATYVSVGGSWVANAISREKAPAAEPAESTEVDSKDDEG